MKIIVPATSANVGPGFDSVGIAVTRYLTIEVLEPSDAWLIEHDLGAGIPTDEKNLLLSTALSIAPAIQPHHIKMTSEVPLARGLGSSSSVIVAGIELANQLGKLSLSDEDKLEIATKIEGHPDNVAPAIFGNLVVASYVDQQTNHLVLPFPECALVAFVPNYELKTSVAEMSFQVSGRIRKLWQLVQLQMWPLLLLLRVTYELQEKLSKRIASMSATANSWLQSSLRLKKLHINTMLMPPTFLVQVQLL